jgi:hypothetical protein
MHLFSKNVEFLRRELSMVAAEIHLMRTENHHLKDIIMALSNDVAALVAQEAESLAREQALLDAYASQKTAIADLNAKLGAIVPGNSMSAEDVAAIQGAVAALHISAAAIEAVLPVAAPAAVEAAPATPAVDPAAAPVAAA